MEKRTIREKVGNSITLCGLLVAGLLWQYVEAHQRYYSRWWHSADSWQSEQKGVLVNRVVLADSGLVHDPDDLRVLDAWYEHQTESAFGALIKPRFKRTGRLRLLIRTPREWANGILAVVAESTPADTLYMTPWYDSNGFSGYKKLVPAATTETLELVWLP